jgi:putative component of membrane protein insertase Oxa1/YidC/SpoIIIJ protein YidD
VLAQSPANNNIENVYRVYQHNSNSSEIPKSTIKKGFYKKHISAQISANCEFKNSCSVYMNNAIQNHGAFEGFLLGIDRLTRCGASQNTYRYLPSLIDAKNNLLHDEMPQDE